MAVKIDLTGKRFTRLIVTKESHLRGSKGEIKWECLCDCGGITNVTGGNLQSGGTKSCGCFGLEKRIKATTKHGLRSNPLYDVYRGMKRRCYEVTNLDYRKYGGRGIIVCERWLESIQNFIDDMFPTFEVGLVLDRINVNGNYEPNNCRWVTKQQSQMNKRGLIRSSAYKGVVWDKVNGKWSAQIRKDRKLMGLGRFYKEEDAAIAYNEAAKELFGDYAFLNEVNKLEFTN